MAATDAGGRALLSDRRRRTATIGLERMLRIYTVQPRFNLSDPAVEEALYDSNSMHACVGD